MKNKTYTTREEILEYFIEKLFALETREKDFIFQRELERLASSLPSWEESEMLFLELKTLAEERGFRII